MKSIKGRDKYNEAQGGTFLSLSLSRNTNAVIKPAIILVLIALILNTFSSLLPTQNAQAAGDWLAGYEYRTKVPVNSTAAGAQTDYQMSVVLHSGTGTSSAGVVYLNGHLQDTTTFNDIRFTASDSSTQKSFWIEKVEDETGGRKATVWVKLDTPVSGSTDYWLYYGKAGDASASSYDNTFTKDFGESGLVGLWHMDEQVPGSELTTNGGFENWTGANCDNWTFDGTSAGARDITKETTTIHSGSNAVKLTATGAGGTAFGLYQNITTTNNAYYQVSVYEEFASRTAGTLKFEAYDNTNSVSLGSQSITTTTAAYSLVNFRFVSTNTTNVKISIYLNSETTTGVAYVDDISVKQSSNTLTDSSGNSYTGTINGAARTSTDGEQWDGRSDVVFSTGSALNFDGKDDWVGTGAKPSNFDNSDITIEAWIKPSSLTANGVIVGRGTTASANYCGWQVSKSNRILTFTRNLGTSASQSISLSNALTNDVLNHIGLTFNYTTGLVTFYINGTQISSGTIATGDIVYNDTYDNGISIGARDYKSGRITFFDGQIDDLRIYNRALSTTEISRQYIESKYASTAPTWATPSSEEQYTFAVTSNAATLLSKNAATLNGNLIGMGDNGSVDVYFKWGTNSGSLDHTTSTQTVSARGAYSQAISGLTVNTTYYYQAFAEGTTTVTGSELSFRTAIDVDFDYYNAFANTDGTMSFTNKTTGETILDSSPKYYLNYGATTSASVSLTNPSFETGAPGTRPTGWTITPADNANTIIDNSADRASEGVQSLKLDMPHADTPHRNIFSSLMTVNQDKSYTISTDTYTSLWWSGEVNIYAYYYTTIDGSGTGHSSTINQAVPTDLDTWHTNTFTWKPPADAKSFKILLFGANSTHDSTVYFDNILVSEVTNTYSTNGTGITPNISTSGNNVTVTSTDNSSATTTVSHKYELNLHSPNIKYIPTLTYKQDVETVEERFDFVAPTQTSSVMTSDLELVSFDSTKTYYSDDYTPKVAKLDNGFSVYGSDDMQSMRLRTSGTTNSQLSFYSDYQYNHPHQHQSAYPGNTLTDNSKSIRSTGDSYSSFVNFSVDPTSSPSTLVKSRQPYGYDATATFTNHADNETTATISAVAYGSEDSANPDYGLEGIIGRGLGWTKSVFVSGQAGADLQDTAFKALTDKLSADGAEIVGHTITPVADSRVVVSAGMQTLLQQYDTINWIDHGSESNPEDLHGRGIVSSDPYYTLDIFANYGYRYAWSYNDLISADNPISIFDMDSPGDPKPFFYYNNQVDDNRYDDEYIYLWSSINTNKTPDTYYTTANIDSLISERGVSIGHEYMGGASCNNHAFYTNPGTGKIEIYPTFDAELAYMASKKEEGLLWSPTVATMGDYLVPLKDILVTNNADGTYTVTNNSSSTVTGVSLLAENAIESVTIDGKQLVSFGGSFGSKELVLPTLTAGQSTTLSISYGAKPSSTPTITSNDTGKNKVNEITGYYNTSTKHLTMTAEGRSGNYSFTTKIPTLAHKVIVVKDTTTGATIGEYTADSSGSITFSAALGSLHTFDIYEKDVTPPNIYGPSITYNDNSATVTWTTDEEASSKVEYGFTTSYVSNSGESDVSPRVTVHSINIGDLASCTQYHYRVMSRDATGNVNYSGDNTFTTTGCSSPSGDEEESTSTRQTWRRYSSVYASSLSEIISGMPTEGTMNSEIRFDGTNLFPGKNIVKYLWDFGDGSTDEGRTVTHTYKAPGRYTIIIKGYDDKGNEYIVERTIDIVPETPTIFNIKAVNDTDLIIEGNGYKGDTIYLSIHSTPINLTSSVDDTGYWSYTINNASETLGEGDHSVTAIDSFKLADNTELKSSSSPDTKFSVTVDNGKLKVEMEKSNRYKMFIYVLIGLIVAMIAVYFIKRKSRR